MKTIIVLAFIGITGASILHQTVVRADALTRTTRDLAETEIDLKHATTKAQAQAQRVVSDLPTPARATTLPGELQDFQNATEALIALRAHLRTDLMAYNTAATAKLAEFDREHAAITDEATQHSMTILRERATEDINARLTSARATLEQLDTVLSTGNDLRHAATCVLIADSLHQHGEDIDHHVQQAQHTAQQYTATTNTLLARINHALAN